jgi:hypothetical protein
MVSRAVIQIITGIVVSVFAAGILLSGGDIRVEWLRFYSGAVLAVIGALALWEHLLWHTFVGQKFALAPRDLRGTWKGTLHSFWIDPSTQQTAPPKPAYLVVRQKAASITVVLLTDESRSTSSMATITDDGTTASLDYMYLNKPDSRIEHRSRMHHGSSSLDITGRPTTRLRGRYWTNRDSRGEMDFTTRVRVAADDFTQAEVLFSRVESSRNKDCG